MPAPSSEMPCGGPSAAAGKAAPSATQQQAAISRRRLMAPPRSGCRDYAARARRGPRALPGRRDRLEHRSVPPPDDELLPVGAEAQPDAAGAEGPGRQVDVDADRDPRCCVEGVDEGAVA